MISLVDSGSYLNLRMLNHFVEVMFLGYAESTFEVSAFLHLDKVTLSERNDASIDYCVISTNSRIPAH